jgi:putative transposase
MGPGQHLATSVQDRDGAKRLLEILRHKFSRLRYIWADHAYAVHLVDWVRTLRPQHTNRLEIIRRFGTAPGVHVSRERWTVEQTPGWFNRYRRPSKEYDLLPQTSEAVIPVAMIHLMIRCLARMIAL